MKEYKRATQRSDYGVYISDCGGDCDFDCDICSCVERALQRLAELEDKDRERNAY